jgi:hypothetical protein
LADELSTRCAPRLGFLLRVSLTAYGCEQDRRARPSDDVNEPRDFEPQHFGLNAGPLLPKDAAIDRRGL